MTEQPYILNKVQDIEAIDLSVIKEVLKQLSPLPKWTFVWKNLMTEVDELAFMETFKFPKLENLKATLMSEGHYSSEEAETILAGLKDLPEYRE